MSKNTVSVVLATYNEENNLVDCLESVKDIAGEIVIVDGSSTDNTIAIAKKYHAKVLITDNPPIFHINKQKALDMATGEWILQLDADERVTKKLADEILAVTSMADEEIDMYEQKLPDKKLFDRHQKLLQKRDGKIGEKSGPIVAFFIPRLNFFLGRYLRFGGVYPDGVIRLVKKGKAHFPCIDVHEQIAVAGRVGWLQNALLHKDSPTFTRYIERNNRYTDLLASELQKEKLPKNIRTGVNYFFIKPVTWFALTFIRHKGFLDGWQGFVFSWYSARRFFVAYKKYLQK